MKADDIFAGVMLYVGCGLMTLVGMGIFDAMPNDTGLGACIGIMVLWPLFAAKYLALGVWAVFSGGFGLLF